MSELARTMVTLTRVDDGSQGTTLYTWVKYSDVLQPTQASEIYDTPTSSTISVGIAYNKTTSTASTDPSVYAWSRIKGTDGLSIDGIQRYYKLSASTPTTYPPSGWSTQEPSYVAGSTDNLYVCDIYTWSDSTTTHSDISLSSSYTAARQAYELASEANEEAESASEQAQNAIDILASSGVEQNMVWADNVLKIGNSDFSIRISGNRMGFYHGDTEVSFMNGANLVISNGYFTNEVKVADKWRFKLDDDNGLTLQYLG